MNKFLAKTIGKWKIWTIVATAVLVVGFVITAIFGFNVAPTADNVNTLTVHVESYVSTSVKEKIEDVVAHELGEKGLNEKYSQDIKLASGKIHEYVYVFKDSVKMDDLNEVKDKIEATFTAEKADEESPLYNAFIYVTVNETEAIANLAKGFVWRGILAGVVIALAVFVYSAIRYKVYGGLLTAGSTLVGALLTVAIVGLVRIPVTASFAYAVAFAELLSAILAVVVMTSLKDGDKADEHKDMALEEKALASIPSCLVATFVCVLAVAIVLVGAIAVTPIAWVGVATFVGLVSATFTSGILLTSVYLPVKALADKKAEKRARYDYKKGAKKVEKESDK